MARIPSRKGRSSELIQSLLDDLAGAPRPGDKNPDSAWHLRHYCRAYTLEAIEKLANLMRCNDPKLALTAASLILDRGWGKPVQQMEVGQPGDFTDLTDAQLEEFIDATNKSIEDKARLKAH